MSDFKRRGLTLTLVVVSFLIFASIANAQTYLDRKVSMKDIAGQPLGRVLKQTSETNGFYFSYNSHSVATDSLVSITEFHGTLLDFLNQLLGADYEYKEMPGYVIIRYVPNAMDVIIQNEKLSGRRLVLNGSVRDLKKGDGVKDASVYVKKALVSTLTDANGNFDLVIKHPDESVRLTVNKYSYRDTTLIYLLPIDIGRKTGDNDLFYEPDDETSEELERTAFGRFFISTRQMIQRINLGGFFAKSPYQVSLTPGLSSHGMFSSQVVNNFSLNVIGGYTAGVNGVELAGVFNMNQKNVQKLQIAGVFNIVGNDMNGVQIAGVSNTVLGNASGVQVAGVWNSTKKMQGIQLSGVGNSSKELHGLQISGVVNHSSGKTGSQVSGLINIGGQVKGIQLSPLLNIADSCDYPIGLINIIKKGRKSFSIETDESGTASLVFRSGGKVLYGVTSIGYNPDNNSRAPYSCDVGLGISLIGKRNFSLDAELVNRIRTDFNNQVRRLYSVKILPSLRVSGHLRFYGGPSINFTNQAEPDGVTRGWVLSENNKNGNTFALGVTTGLRFRW